MSSYLTWTLAELKPQDWDFRPEVLFDSELVSCWHYEFSRELVEFREIVADSRKRNSDFTAKVNSSVSKTSARPVTLGESLMTAWFKPPVPLAYGISPQWPDTPYALLKNKPRAGDHNWTFFYFQKDINKFVHDLVAKPDFHNLPKTIWDDKGKSETVVFSIPWLYPNDDLIKGFAQWLTDNRPEGKAGDLRPKVEPIKRPTGAASRPRQLRADLKALGAYRLLQCYKGNRSKARSHADVSKILGKDFYNNESAWTDAKKRAMHTIQWVEGIKETKIELEKMRKQWEIDEDFRSEYNRVRGIASTEKK